MIRVRAFPRLHIGLIDLGGSSGRRYGGAGFMLDWCPVEVDAEPGRRMIAGLELLDRRGRNDVRAALSRLYASAKVLPARIALRSSPTQHIGLGTKTATVLAVLKAAAHVSGVTVGTAELQALSRRGGASGIGIHGFFRGGFIVDAGHQRSNNVRFLPSAASHAIEMPALVARIPIPARWRFVLFKPPGIRYSGAREVRFFRENTPVPSSEVRKSLSILYHGIVPSVIEGRLDALRMALFEMHQVGFKRREVEGQSVCVRQLIEHLRSESECAVGMSSMGPLVYAIVPSIGGNQLDTFGQIARTHNAELLGTCNGRNRSYEII
jgi:beta-ribofuranosylaminobenzene 5'-phosphate synthase